MNPEAFQRMLEHELGSDWRTPLPLDPSPDEEIAVWMADYAKVERAAQRVHEKLAWTREWWEELAA